MSARGKTESKGVVHLTGPRLVGECDGEFGKFGHVFPREALHIDGIVHAVNCSVVVVPLGFEWECAWIACAIPTGMIRAAVSTLDNRF